LVYRRTAGGFNRAFYKALAEGITVDEAVTAGRQALSVEALDQRDWSTPVLQLGTRLPGGLRLGTGGDSDPWDALQEAAEASARSREALHTVVGSLRDLAGALEALDTLLGWQRDVAAAQKEWERTVRQVEELVKAGGPTVENLVEVGSVWKDFRARAWEPLLARGKTQPVPPAWWDAANQAEAALNEAVAFSE
jgi:hypothetical protein